MKSILLWIHGIINRCCKLYLNIKSELISRNSVAEIFDNIYYIKLRIC
jgi:hypothetical protein